MDKVTTRTFLSQALLLVIATFGISVLLKAPFLFSSALVLDDLSLFVETLSPDFSPASINRWLYAALNRALEDPGRVRILYGLLISLSAVAIFRFLTTWGIDKKVSFSICLLSVMAPTNAIIGAFINGSYALHFVMLFFLGAVLVSESLMSEAIATSFRWLLLVSGLVLVFGSSFFGTNSALLPMAIIFLPWFLSPLRSTDSRKFQVMLWIICSVVSLASLAAVWRVLGHPYTGMTDRLQFSLGHLVTNSWTLVALVFKSFYHPMVSTGSRYEDVASVREVSVFACVFAVIVFTGALRFMRSLRCFSSGYKLTTKEYCSFLMPFLLVAAIVAIGTTAPNTRLHMWHMFLPSLFVLSFVICVLASYVDKRLVLIIVICMTGISVNAMSQVSSRLNKSAELQLALSEAIGSVSEEWGPNNTKVIILAREPYLSGFNSAPRVRGSGFVRFHTKREDVGEVYIGELDRLGNVMSASASSAGVPMEKVRIYRFNERKKTLESAPEVVNLSERKEFGELLEVCRKKRPGDLVSSVGSISAEVLKTDRSPVWAQTATLSRAEAVSYRVPENSQWVIVDFSFEGEQGPFRIEGAPLNDRATPMLWRTNNVQIWQTAENEWKLHLGISNKLYVFNGIQLDGSLSVIDGCMAVVTVNGRANVEFGDFRSNGVLQFGEGYKSRFWSGSASVKIYAGNNLESFK